VNSLVIDAVETGLDRGRDAPGAAGVPEGFQEQILIALLDAHDAREPLSRLEITQQRLDGSQGHCCRWHARILAGRMLHA
jgi:hypothetical protein